MEKPFSIERWKLSAQGEIGQTGLFSKEIELADWQECRNRLQLDPPLDHCGY